MRFSRSIALRKTSEQWTAELSSLFGGEWRVTLVFWWYACADGRIATVLPKVPRVMTGYLRSGGYLWLAVPPRTGEQQSFAIHTLVCEAFHGPRPDGGCVRHLDGNGQNNAADNVAWGSYSDNELDKRLHGRDQRGERNGGSRLTAADVMEIRRLRKDATPYAVLAERFGVHWNTVYRAGEGHLWKHLEQDPRR